MTGLFEVEAPRPLADRLRPESLDRVGGQGRLDAGQTSPLTIALLNPGIVLPVWLRQAVCISMQHPLDELKGTMIVRGLKVCRLFTGLGEISEDDYNSC